jgi:hypothetical protein
LGDVQGSNGASNAFTLESTMKIDVIEYVTYKSINQNDEKFSFFLLLTSGLMLSAQVGINTDSPKAKLDVNGDLNLRDKIAVLDVTDNTLSMGNNDQLLVSQGEGYPPIWKTLRIPEYEPNKFYLIFNNSLSDNTGVIFIFGTA